MLKPTKHSDPDKTVIAIATLLLSQLSKKRIQAYDSLHDFVGKKVESGEILFLPAMNFLFLLGLVKYHPKTDSFEILTINEAK